MFKYRFEEMEASSLFHRMRTMRGIEVPIRLVVYGKRKKLQEFFRFLDILTGVKDSGEKVGVKSEDIGWVPNVTLRIRILVDGNEKEAIANYLEVAGAEYDENLNSKFKAWPREVVL